MNLQLKFDMGDMAKDAITGFTGTVTGATTYITGCTTYLVQPRLKKDGDFVDARWVDEDRLEKVGRHDAADRISAAAASSPAPGGDKPAPIR